MRQFATAILLRPVRLPRLPRLKTLHKNNPTLNNALIYGGLYTAAEISQQTFHKYRASAGAVNHLTATPIIDVSSIGRYAVMGMGVFGPLSSKWYTWIDKTFPSKAMAVVFKKTLINQFLYTPVCVAVFYIGMAVMEGCKGAKIFEELIEKGPRTFAMDCCFWIPCTVSGSFI